MKNRYRIQTLSLLFLVSMIVSTAFGQYGRRANTIRWADDTHYFETQKDKKGNDVLMIVDAATGKATKAKKKTQDEQASGTITARVKNGNIYLINPADDSERQVTANPGLEKNPRFSPDHKLLAFTRDHDLFVLDIESGLETRLTTDGEDLIYNGYASWVYFEEILGRGSRYAAFWWSPDGKKISFLRFDDHPVPLFTLMRADSLHGAPEFTRYPKPGDPNPIVKLGIADVKSGKVSWADFDETVDQYIAFPSWNKECSEMLIQVLNRDQNDMKLFMVDPENGNVRKIYQEKRKTWINFYSDLHVMEDGSGFILRSTKSDWNNLYYYDWNGKLNAQLTDLDFRVNRLSKVDIENGKVYFTATGKESTDSHFFSVNLDGSELVQLTEGTGVHRATLSPGGSFIIDSWSNVKLPSKKVIRDAQGKMVRVLEEKEYTYNPAENTLTEMLRIPSTDGFILPAKITYPLNFDKNKKYPVVFTVYGGPNSGGFSNNFSDGYASWYAKNNIITINVAHRASGHFGKRGLDYMWRNLGKWEVIDYSAAVKWLRDQPYVDSEKIGMTGGSYGGYMTAMALTSGADFWTHGIANLSVTSWRLYDNVYTERFMDTPQQNPEGYDAGSVMEHAHKLKGKLRIVHGEMDDNVHMQNSLQLAGKLQDLGKDFEFMIYPNGRHGWGGEKSKHNRNEQYQFWMKHFFNKDFEY
ncbi:MAG: prolyl oligopeptidase family serine peptidase [Bacteroidetes bacterium]|mgnify:CR=1 FL=1|jgi:dipeptidyl-peptidase 4|nr:prolyl oligopeptidase family serine peptidase [Bacteroidota bacterium]MBT4400813.1 prolyl oligopeptidase family serine peptidase [Bacteroidota bacterium]MBT5426746.1 prolyl oligopeptidase family serine peptidase [Bacteroidota bacterium]MBT7466454.1 prolyl oligopeptidase family serine peptidase [Bacteroidota bacterium]